MSLGTWHDCCQTAERLLPDEQTYSRTRVIWSSANTIGVEHWKETSAWRSSDIFRSIGPAPDWSVNELDQRGVSQKQQDNQLN